MTPTMVETAHKSAMERIDEQIAQYDAILARRGAWYEDEEVARKTLAAVKAWLCADKEEKERQEWAAMEAEEERLRAEEEAKEAARKADPNYETRKLFENSPLRKARGLR